jgi:hypothetical protein
MRAMKLASAAGTSALLLCALASASGAQERARQRAPIIRVYSSNGSYALQTTSYVTPVIEVSENAYVFAVSMDVDGHIQVLHPDFPGISVRMLAHKQLKLPSFFAGFARRNAGDGYYSSAGYSGYSNYDDDYPDSRGTVIALASRAPFNLELIESDGDWNISTIRRQIEGRSPESAAQALARYLGAEGEPIGRDFMRFAGGRNYNSGYSYAYGAYSSCDLYGYSYAPTLAARYFQANTTIGLLRQRGQRATVGYDVCGFPFVIFQPSSLAGGFRPPGTRPPQSPGDTTVFPKSRLPHGFPRRPTGSGANAAPLGIFPLPQRAGLPQIGDVTIKAPTGRRSEPGQIIQGYRPQTGTMSAPQGRIPIERVTTPRAEPAAATGVQPVRDYRPEPRSAAPPPSRVPDAPRQAPPPPTPVVHERPSAPPPPPPTTKSEPARVPPPNRK